MDLLEDLEFRDLIYQVTNRDGLQKQIQSGPITLYIGFDPTADSLHIGNLLQILLLRRFQLTGHRPIAVVGGGTGLIGDPSGKSSERRLNTESIVAGWSSRIRQQLERFLDFDSPVNPAVVVNNHSWLNELAMIPFLRDIGKHFSIGSMLGKESVRSRLEGGISYTEFTYLILQAYDFLQLNQERGCVLQAGGSDQWGNITAGVDLIRRETGKAAYGLTLPLVTQANGKKLGKTESGTIWLDPVRTTPYQFYQYWISIADQDVIRFLKYFTFLSMEEYADLQNEVEQNPAERKAQRTLAREVTTLVHGRKDMQKAENVSNALFYHQVADLSLEEIEQGLHGVPTYTIVGDQNVKLVDLLVEAKISPSKRRAREDINNRAISINDEKRSDVNTYLTKADRIEGKYIIVRRGKTAYYLVDWSG